LLYVSNQTRMRSGATLQVAQRKFQTCAILRVEFVARISSMRERTQALNL
jgi:hypothetical protein